jgi:hypothetical protein
MSPFVGRVVDRMEPWYATLIASSVCLAVYALQTAAAGLNVAVVIIVCFGMDIFRQTQQVSISTKVLGLDPLARSRLNAVLIIAVSIRLVGLSHRADSSWSADLHRADHGHCSGYVRV